MIVPTSQLRGVFQCCSRIFAYIQLSCRDLLVMTTALIYNATVWKWNSVNSDFTISAGELGRAEPNCFVTLKNGFVTTVSSSNEAVPSFGLFGTVLNAHGRLLLPGLTGSHNETSFAPLSFFTHIYRPDSHIHVAMLGESQYFVNLGDCYSVDSMKKKVSSHIEKYPDLPWVIGVNWDQTNLGVYPRREHIDCITTDKPVSRIVTSLLYFSECLRCSMHLSQIFLWRACWHIGLANSTALRLAGIIGRPAEECSKVSRVPPRAYGLSSFESFSPILSFFILDPVSHWGCYRTG